MSQTSENKQISAEAILKILHSEVQQMPPSQTSSRYLRALRSLTATSHNHVLASPPPQRPQREMQQVCSDWIVNMWLLGVPYTTASLNLDIISALYGSAAKAGRLPKTTLFSELKASLKQLGPDGWKSGINEEIFARALRLTKNAHRLLLDDSIAADLIILSLNSGLQPLESLALLPRDPESHAKSQSKIGDDGGEESSRSRSLLSGEESVADNETFAPLREALKVQDEQLLQGVIARHAPNARRKYIFPLNQTQRSEAQLKKHVAKIANALFGRARLPQSTDPNHTVEALWAYAALRAGIPATAVAAHLAPLHPGTAPLGLPILRLVPALASPAPQRPQREMQEVGKIFLDNPARWYAMSLRPGVRFTQLTRRLDLLTSNNSQLTTDNSPDLFYPCEEIARAIGKKIVIKQRPFIHSVVFFKAKLTDIGPLFARIGDLAWCYRQSAAPGVPYAEISEQQFRQFQQTIACFTPDYEVASAGDLELRPDDRVQIVGGLFAGHEATVEANMGGRFPNRPVPSKGNFPHTASADTPYCEANTPSTVYRLNIVGDNGIEWRITADSRVIKPGPQASPRVPS